MALIKNPIPAVKKDTGGNPPQRQTPRTTPTRRVTSAGPYPPQQPRQPAKPAAPSPGRKERGSSYVPSFIPEPVRQEILRTQGRTPKQTWPTTPTGSSTLAPAAATGGGGDGNWWEGGGGGGGGGDGGWAEEAAVVPPAWWGEPWFGEGRAVQIPGLGTVNLRDMQTYNQIDPLYRSWLQQAVNAAGEQGWWASPMISPVNWMRPVFEEM